MKVASYTLLICALCTLFCIKSASAQQAPSVSKGASASVKVLPKTTDFQLLFESTSLATSFNQYSSIPFQITYGSDVFYNAPIILEASWEEGIIQGSSSTVNVVTYEWGTASNAYGSTAPVIDLSNKKITWTIAAFPSQTRDNIVTFSLNTYPNYTGIEPVTFTVKAKLIGDTVELPQESVVLDYQYDPALAATPAPTSQSTSPSSSPTSTPTASSAQPTPTKSPTAAFPKITSVDITSITSKQSTINVSTKTNTKIIINYGTNPADLNQTISSLAFKKNHKIILSNLSQDTVYYVRLTLIDQNNNKTVSELFTFQTARESLYDLFSKDSLVITSQKSVLVDPSTTKIGTPPDIFLPKQVPLEMKLNIDNSLIVKKIMLEIRNKNVLGATTDTSGETTPSSQSAPMVELTPGTYTGRLLTPESPGEYEVVLKITDKNNRLTEQLLANLYISEAIRVFNATTQQPLENVQIFMHYKNRITNKFQLIPPNIIPISNPSYTNTQGALSLSLPQGQYLLKARMIGFKEKEIEFTIGANSATNYPTVLLEEDGGSLSTSIAYYSDALATVARSAKSNMLQLATTNKFFEFNMLLTIFLLVSLTFVSLRTRLPIPLHKLIHYLEHHTRIAQTDKNAKHTITGSIFDENSQSIPSADVLLLEDSTDTIMSHTKSNKQGFFNFAVQKDKKYFIEVFKDGYQLQQFRELSIEKFTLKAHLQSQSISKRIISIIRYIFSASFEILLAVSLISEIFIGYALGWQKVAPLLLTSLVCLGIWVVQVTGNKPTKTG